MPRTVKSKKIEAPSAAPVSAEADESPVANASPTTEEIEKRAYEIYIARAGDDGSALEDWLQAERELLGINDGDNDISQ